MILQALNDYYDRKSEDDDDRLAPFGFELKEIPFVIEINATGELVEIHDTREGQGKSKTAKSYLVPQGVKRASNIAANLLWDNLEYALGVDTRGKPERVVEQHAAFISRLNELSNDVQNDVGIKAVLVFLEGLNLAELELRPLWGEIKESNPNMSFRLHGETALICQRPVVVAEVKKNVSAGDEAVSHLCLVSGKPDEMERLHTTIKGVWGAQSSGANIVSFNLNAFNSYGKTQGENSPVGKQAAFAYTTALNHLLRKGSRQRIQVGDASTVFWSEKPSDFETMIPDIFGESPKDNPDQRAPAVAALYRSINAGLLERPEGDTRFYILGLAPNAARIAVRFWHVATVAEVAKTIRQHFDDIAIEHGPNQLPHLPLFRLLVSTATLGKADNIPANLAGEFMRTILAGLPYPQTLLASAVRRIHAEHEITYARAALIKGCINRMTRYKNPEIKEELKMALDESNQNIGYRLGRLFAVLEKIQEEASPGLNATIRDRYYSSAASTPVTVFSTLMRLKNHHLGKLHKGRAVNLEKLIGTIVDGFNNFPAHLKLEDQGRFAIGYYHQRHDFFKKHSDQDQGE